MEPLSPQQLADEGQAEYKKAQYLSAARLYKAAADGYSARGEAIMAAEMANNCSVAYLKAGEAELALESAQSTDQLFETNGDRLRQAMAIGNQAAALEELKRFDEAEAGYLKSAELLNSIGEFELRAYVLQSLSSVQMRQGRYLEAYATMNAGVMGIKKPDLTQRILKSLMQVPFKFLK
jgi:tetratricopeptide (TPR) repeat protein